MPDAGLGTFVWQFTNGRKDGAVHRTTTTWCMKEMYERRRILGFEHA